MNWKLVFLLSLFGLAMAFATVFWIPSNLEPFFWLVILAVSAYVIAGRVRERHFLHGLTVGVLNGVWMTSGHVLFFDTYVANHASEAAMMARMASPRLMMLPVGMTIGVVSGCIIGLASVVAARLGGQTPAPTTT